MYKMLTLAVAVTAIVLFSNCQKKVEAPPENIATAVVSNLSTISAGYTPTSLASVSASGISAQSDPCAGVTDFAVCQSNLIREYLKIGKATVDSISQIAGAVGSALGQVPDGNAGTSTDGKISWNKTSSALWSVIARGTGSNPYVYMSVNGGTYTLKVDANYAETSPAAQQIEATITYTSATDWTVDVFFGNDVCDSTDVGQPSKAHIKLTKANGLWTGKAMLYVPRWQSPGTTLTCASTAGTSEITMYTDFVGNDVSTKAALYLIPASVSDLSSPAISTYDLPDFCTNFGSSCGAGPGQVPVGFLDAKTNNWCTTGAGTTPTWGDSCSTNTAVNAASFSSLSEWTAPAALETKTVTMPTTL